MKLLRSLLFSTAALAAAALPGFASAGTILVSYNGDNSVHRFDSLTGADLGTFASTPGPSGIGFDVLTSTVYVASYANGTILKFAADGTALGSFVTGLTGVGPSGLAVDSTGNVYVTLYDGAAINKYSPAGTLLGSFSTGGAYPDGIAFDSSSNSLLVNYYTGPGSGAVHRFSLTGSDLGSLVTGLSNPLPITVDGSGNFYLSEWTLSTLKKFSPSGTLLSSASAQLYGLVINENNLLLGANTFGQSITQYDLNLGSPGTFASTGAQYPGYLALIPEPSRALLLAGGLIVSALYRRRGPLERTA